MDNSLIPRPFSPTDAKRDREEKARLAERGDSSLWVAGSKTADRLAAETAQREAALADNASQLGDLNVRLDTELPILDQKLVDNKNAVEAAQAQVTAVELTANGASAAASAADLKALNAAAAADAAAVTANAALPKIIAGASQKTFLTPASLNINSTGLSTGELIIQTPIPVNVGYMCRIDVKGFIWAAASELEASINFYITAAGAINNPSFSTTGAASISRVRIMQKTSTGTIALVLTSPTGAFSYIKAAVERALIGLTLPPDSLGTGWTMAIGTDLSAFTLLADITTPRDINDTHKLAQGWRTTGQTTIDGGKITADSVTAGQIAADAITATELAADAVTAAKIKSGEITAAKLVAGTLTSASGVFGTMDASVINAGTLNAARLAAGSIFADKLVIGGAANGMPDPTFASQAMTDLRTSRSSGGTAGWTKGMPTATGIPTLSRVTASANDIFNYSLNYGGSNRIGSLSVGEGQKWQLSVDVETSASAGVRWNVYKYMADGTIANTSLSPYSTASGRRALSYTYVIPAGVVAVEFGLACNVSGVTWTVYGNAVVALQAGATLIEDGAVISTKILAKAVTAGKIDVGAVTATEIAADAVTATKILAGSVGTNHMVANSINADRLVAASITAAKLSAGSVTADKLESSLVLATKILAGDVAGTRAEMSPDGFRVFAAGVGGGPSTEVVRLGVASTDDYFAVTRADGTLAAAISQDGVISGTQLNANDSLYYKGKELGTLLDSNPFLVAAAQRTTNSKNNAVAGGAFVPYLRLEVKLKPYRMYKVWTSAVRINVDANTGATLALGYQNGILADISNVAIFTQANTEAQPNGGARSLVLQELFAFPGTAEATISFLLMFGVQEGAGQAATIATAQQPVRLVVEDWGPTQYSVANGVWLDSATAPPAPKNTYVKAYGANNSMNYQGSNAQYAFDTGRMYQGLSPAGYGNLKSLALFPDMVADLSGATINYIRVYFNFSHWYNNAGGTARIGVHGHTGIPTTFSTSGVVATSGGWPKPGARWVDLPSSVFAGFKSGAYRGVTLEGDNTYGTYGIADRPTIEISYTK